MPDRKTVLLVEDTPEQAAVFRVSLEAEEDLSVLQAASLAEARTLLDEGGVDALVLDLGLPDAFGLQAVQTASAATPRVPFVVLSANAQPALALAAVELGADDFLVKGRDDARLAMAVRFAMTRASRRAELEARARRLERLLHSTPDALLVVDDHQRVVRANEAAGRLYGREAHLLVGKPLQAEVPDGARVQLRVTRAGGKQRRAVAQGRWVTIDGTTLRLVSIREEDEAE